MKINEVSGQRVNVSAHTITIKDDADKTRGLVKGIDNLYEIQPNKQFQYAQILARAGVDRASYMSVLHQILIHEGKLYYLVDNYVLEIEKRLGETKLQNLIQELSKAVEIIYCKRITWATKRK